MVSGARPKLRALLLISVVGWLTACTAVHTSVAKRDLDVQTRMSETIYLDPVDPEQRTIFLDIRQTAPEYQLPLEKDVRQLLLSRDYRIVDSPMEAQYWLQVNVRSVQKEHPEKVLASEQSGMSREEIYALLNPGLLPPAPARPPARQRPRHSANVLITDTAAANQTLDSRQVGRVLAVLAVFAGAEYVGRQLVQDRYYTMLTDVQVAERVPEGSADRVLETGMHQLHQGDSGTLEQLWERATDRRRYQVRVVSFANRANLSWSDAEQPLHEGLLRSLTGIF